MFLNEKVKQENRESQIYLILRVLFIRFSHENLLEVLIQLWPMIYADIITRLTTKNNNEFEKDVNIKFAVLKFLEFLSVVNKEYFSAFQWVFFQDTNDLSRIRQDSEVTEIVEKSENSVKEKDEKYSKKCTNFKPLAMQIFENCKIDSEFKEYSENINLASVIKEPLIMGVAKVIFIILIYLIYIHFLYF